MTPALPALLAARRTVGRREFDFSRQVAVMAIVNRTPDSFWDRGATFALDRAVSAALAAVDDGADWVDVGGVPFSPDTPEVSVAEESDRVVPLVAAIAERSDVVISVDTTRAPVAAAAIAAGASVVNDTNGVRDPAMVELLSEGRAAVVVTHSLAAPHTHLPSPRYGDVVGEVATFLRERVDALTAAGIPADRLFIDPGPDLNKNTAHTLELLRRLPEITSIGLPVLAAVSNKDFIGETLDRPPGDRLPGSLAATTLAVAAGARVVRTHQVAATVDAVRLTEAVLGLREPAYLRHNV
ncbi:dihydropteroate synthase [Georgenia sp. H159]|uniref:dihydropteroate synthase n=1 Tax=Georgenia sp. H159 TaxID=3076115 RepID=UPI002D79A69E|nr:dihydropteroate synthase [Georgenia sp. H159]